MTSERTTQTAVAGLQREFQADELQVMVSQDAGALAGIATELASRHLRETLARQEGAAVILATGQSQLIFLEKLFQRPEVDWRRVTFFHMDEYLGLAAEHPASFRRYLRERVESRIQCRAFHYLTGDALEPIQECERYTRLLQAQPIDLCFQGIGDNGHLAFNDPPVARFDDPYAVKIVKLDEICRQQQVNQGQFSSIDAMPQYALTLTIPTLCAAHRILCLAPGRHKATIVRKTLQGPIEPSCPATVLRRLPQATLLLEPESARLLA